MPTTSNREVEPPVLPGDRIFKNPISKNTCRPRFGSFEKDTIERKEKGVEKNSLKKLDKFQGARAVD